MTKFIDRRKNTVARFSCKKKLFGRKEKNGKPYNKKIDSQDADEDYGDVEDLIDDEEWTRCKTEFLNGLEKIK